jgi:pseudouridine-5'-phosphate glycosidase
MASASLGSLVDIDVNVRRVLDQRGPVVALESTIITHGIPYLENLATARSPEEVIRAEGATPATIAVIRMNGCTWRRCVSLTLYQFPTQAREGREGG